MRYRFMVVVAGFAYRIRLSRKEAYELRKQLRHCVKGIRVEKMPEVVG